MFDRVQSTPLVRCKYRIPNNEKDLFWSNYCLSKKNLLESTDIFSFGGFIVTQNPIPLTENSGLELSSDDVDI